jgi:hypothetical protein
VEHNRHSLKEYSKKYFFFKKSKNSNYGNWLPISSTFYELKNTF